MEFKLCKNKHTFRICINSGCYLMGKDMRRHFRKYFYIPWNSPYIVYMEKYNCIKPSYYVSDQVTFLKREIDLQMDTRNEMVITNPYGPEKVSTRSHISFWKNEERKTI